MYKKKTLICSVVLSIMALLPFVVSAETIISSSVVLNQSVLDGYTWPITIQGGTINHPVVVKLTENITLTTDTSYFIIGSEYVTFDGNGYNITINTGRTYPGVIKNGSSIGSFGYSNITIKNIKLTATTDQLINTGGWIGQEGFGYNATNVTIDNCHSNTTQIGTNAGGIVGRYSPVTVTNCSSTGPIGPGGGGICGKYFSGTAVNCHSAGAISGNAGGIIGSFSSGTATNCYSTGNITGIGSGGIMGSDASINTTAANCYSRGTITGSSAGGIMAQKSKGKVTNCYSTGTITGTNAGGIVGDLSSGTIAHCYTFASTIMGGTSTSSITDCLVSGAPWSDTRASSVLTGTDGTVWSGYRDGVEEPFTLASITPFVTTWQTDANNQIIIPLMGDGYDFYIDWGDGTTEYKYDPSGDISHTYFNSVSDNYTITITPKTFTGFPRIYLNEFSNSSLLLEIKQWGGGEWSNMNNSFSGASNLTITATDVPDLSEVTDLSYMFFNASSVNSDLSGWDVSGVTKMNNMFDNASSFNGSLNGWDVSKVTDMSYMFINANSFNSDIGNWNISHVTNTTGMFSGALSFNANLKNWNVSSITEMSNMFTNATSFNSDLSDWNVSNITNMESMFNNASSFNGELSSWNVSNVTNMSNMFNNASSFNGDLSTWDVSSVNNVNGMFNGALSFNARLNNWNVSNISDMSYMFSNASAFNSNLSDWNVSNVTNMSDMFSHASSFNRDLSNWDVSGVTNMSNMFNNASTFNGALGSWNVSNVTNMRDMFSNASVFNKDLSSWNVSNVIYINSMFSNALMFDQDLSAWNISNVTFASNFLVNAKLSTTNYDALLIGWSNVANQIPSSLDINFGKSKYSDNTAVIAAKTYLAETKSWTINDGGMYTPPVISSTLLALNNSTIQVTFSERVYSNITGTSDLEASDFSFAIAGGSATLSSATPISISTTDNISFILGIGLAGKPDAAETLTLSPLTNAIYNLAMDVASINQSNNTALLYEPLVTRNGQIGTTDSSYVDKNGKTGSGTGLNPSGKAIVRRSTND